MAGKLTRIWRVENARGGGPYRRAEFGGLLKELSSMGFNMHADQRRPGPDEDTGIADFFNSLSEKEKRRWVYGFKSLRQYRQWFNTKKARDLLHNNGFFLTRYEVETGNTRQGEKQTAFIRRKGAVTELRDCHGAPLSVGRGLTTAIKDLAKRKELSLKMGAAATTPRPTA